MRAALGQNIGPEKVQQIIEIAGFQHEAFFHVSLAKLQFRIEHDAAKPGL